MERHPPADNAAPHFLTMMVRAPRAVDLLADRASTSSDADMKAAAALAGPSHPQQGERGTPARPRGTRQASRGWRPQNACDPAKDLS